MAGFFVTFLAAPVLVAGRPAAVLAAAGFPAAGFPRPRAGVLERWEGVAREAIEANLVVRRACERIRRLRVRLMRGRTRGRLHRRRPLGQVERVGQDRAKYASKVPL